MFIIEDIIRMNRILTIRVNRILSAGQVRFFEHPHGDHNEKNSGHSPFYDRVVPKGENNIGPRVRKIPRLLPPGMNVYLRDEEIGITPVSVIIRWQDSLPTSLL
ncbi:hypothetical protein [uncultured Methanoregula sp.]|uniref:hypothetical protein n=1 Tax=uncultured Methanoregula sp. TaxID=1005933 RepID=UPI002AABC79D|nr:hypothetical protein [uncultured Methanoregula sp.]